MLEQDTINYTAPYQGKKKNRLQQSQFFVDKDATASTSSFIVMLEQRGTAAPVA